MDSQAAGSNSLNLQLFGEYVIQNDLLCTTDDQDQNSVAFHFQPFRFLFNDLIEQIKQLKEDVKQIRQQNETEKQAFVEQLTQQSTKIEQLENEINHLKTTGCEHSNHINKIQIDYQQQNFHLSEINQRHDLLKIKVESIEKYTDYYPQQLVIPNLNINQRWNQNGTTKAGGHGRGGSRLNQLNRPFGLYIDDDRTIYVTDTDNHRIIEWKSDAINGRIVAGGRGQGNRNDQLNQPTNVIVDKQNNSFIICDRSNRRVVRWSRRNAQSGEILISNIDCSDLIMDNDGYLYISDIKKHEVRRWKIGEPEGTIVAGGNGQGDRLDQLNCPAYIFVDEDHSIYVSDMNNHRVMKWLKDAREGVVVAGGHGQGNGLRQLSAPVGIIVDQLGSIYVTDWGNDRVMRWLAGAEEGTIVVGVNGRGEESNQFVFPVDLSFDRDNNLYVVDFGNNRIQKFDIDL